MTDEDAALRRVRFYGPGDLAAGLHSERIGELLTQFDAADAPKEVMDLLELHNVQQYLEHGFLPRDATDSDRAAAKSRVGQIRSAVARFFSAVDDSNCASVVAGVDYEYHEDLLDLLGRNRAFERCSAPVMLSALHEAHVHLGKILSSRKLVMAYDAAIREELLAAPSNGEHLVRKYLQKDASTDVHLPASFTAVDARALLESYLDSADANPNYVGLIETAPVTPSTGIDAKLKLRAKRRNAEMTQRFFEENTGFTTATEVSLVEAQDEPVKFELDDSEGLTARFTYSRDWLDETTDNPSILNNFQHLFEFANGHVLLTLPAYPTQMGVLEGLFSTAGASHYQVTAAFRAVDASSHLQTRMYQHYLESKDKDVEEVVSWFFQDYFVEEFGASNFSFRPSSRGGSYLERVRNLFAEMESVMTQFSLFVENGELDRDLLAITSEQIRYKQVPSLLPGKYAYPTAAPEIVGILQALFSNQSGLAYINEDLSGNSAAELLLKTKVAYEQFHDYQKGPLDRLIQLGILENTGDRVRFAAGEVFLILRSLYSTQACSYYHLSESGRAEVDAMVAKGWVNRRSSLLSQAEAEYFNYFLNNSEFSNGPALRNKYQHGLQADAEGEGAHYNSYITALKLMIALVIKLNDDFCLSASEEAVRGTRGRLA